jgi:predicted nucleic acid-binding Zn ribbon protein
MSDEVGPAQPGPAQPGSAQPGPSQPGPAQPGPAERGRRLLDRARQSAPAPSRRPRRRPAADEVRWSGPGPDPRDPAPLAASVGDLVRDRDWEDTLRAAGIPARWEQLVGAEIAAHCRPERLDAGELSCVAESTAWATQIRMLSATILARLATEVGPGVVRRLHVHGPTAPDWRHGPLRVTGRGPRDTYG